MRNPNTTKAYNYLRKRILAGDFPPGGFLSAQSLSKDIGVSRTPVREALRQLEYDELVTIVPKLGAVVKTLSQDQFQDLLGYREALEVYASGRAATLRRPEEVEQLKAALEAMKDAVGGLIEDPQDADLLQQLVEQDIRFHRAIFAMARNDFIREKSERAHILQRMLAPSVIAKFIPSDDVLKSNARSVYEEHSAIYAAIRDGDAPAAQAAMSRHLGNFARKVSHQDQPPADHFPAHSAEVIF